MRLREALKSKAAPWIGVITGLLLILLVAPDVWTPMNSGRASTFNDDPFGISGFFRVAARLGWKTERRTTESLTDIGAGTLVSIDPIEQLTPRETHTVLEEVRHGAGLLISADPNSPIADSLGILLPHRRGVLPLTRPRAGCRRIGLNPMLPFGDRVYVSAIARARHSPLRDSTGVDFFPLDTSSLIEEGITVIGPAGSARVRTRPGEFDRDSVAAVARGFQYGLGRIVVITSALPLRNDIMRICTVDAAVPAIAALQYLANGRASRIIFDEYRHGYGERGHIWGVLGEVFTGTTAGRALLNLVVAGLIFLAAGAVRDVRPRPRMVLERRSPFEHVDALAAAYLRAGATTLATRRLMQGLRRRLPARMSAGTKESDQRYLEHLATADPGIAPAVDTVRNALGSRTNNDHLLVVGKSIEHIERSVKGE